MKLIYSFITLIFSGICYGQNFTDTVYQIQTSYDIVFGNQVDFAGNQRDLFMDISTPTNDNPGLCKRPLLIAIHGGAWIAGDKSENNISRIREDFAKRGYVTASINYRLGQFNTHQANNCNVQAFGLEWNCLNMGDTSEWYRGYYRGIQDANSAIRYLVNHASTYQINTDQIFLVGESAGGFIAMGAGFIDDVNEIPQNLVGMYPDIQAPNTMYEQACVQGYNLDTNIASMNLSRPALGAIDAGDNYPINEPYHIVGVGNFFGGAFNNIFASTNGTPPALYLFHQPNDLIVPFNSQKVFAGYNTCLQQFPFNCGSILNRPTIMGSNKIKTWLDDLANNGQVVPTYMTDFTNNTTPCSTTPGHGHAYDNFWLRTNNLADFFAGLMYVCDLNVQTNVVKNKFEIFPNPMNEYGEFNVFGEFENGNELMIHTMDGRLVYQTVIINPTDKLTINFNIPKGAFIISISKGEHQIHKKLIVE